MTQKTEAMLSELSLLIDKNKYLLLSGTSAVGKTFLAMQIAENCKSSIFSSQGSLPENKTEYSVEVEIVPIHPAFSYEDFVTGISFKADGKNFSFEYQDKIFLQMLKNANASWKKQDGKKYFLIIDDIGRGNFSSVLGNVLPMMETHGASVYGMKTNDGYDFLIPPNLYVIATINSLVDNGNSRNFGLLRHFFHKPIDSDYGYMDDDASEYYGDYDISAGSMYCKTKCIISENLRHRHRLTDNDCAKYYMGHGVFKPVGTSMVMRYQVLPMLRQYIKDNVLDRSAYIGIAGIEQLLVGSYSKDLLYSDHTKITNYRKDVDPKTYYDDAVTHHPIVNLVHRIITQGLLSDTEISDNILFNKGILIRKSAGASGAPYPAPAYLYVKKTDRDIYTYTKSHRFLYSAQKKDGLTINGIEYTAAAEMQPKEYTRWSTELDSDEFENERYSSSPNSIMFRILRAYYHTLCYKFENYLVEKPDDNNIRILCAFAKNEFSQFIKFVETIGSGSDEADVNLERNSVFRKGISQLKLLWSNTGDLITWNGQTVKVEGVYKVSVVEQYKEYADAMETLDIHQMILQGPPGTSKTYSAREFLKYLINDGGVVSDSELDEMQITDYSDGSKLTAWNIKHPGESPKIAWDIVQFHPSYGYEDFVRGIEVSTVTDSNTNTSTVSYDTANKILGKIAEVAGRPEYHHTMFILLVDEINRANLSTVFGELIYGLEYRGRNVATPYTVNNSNKVTLPSNLYVIGTMNTADKSIGGIDYAIRRRFLFFPLLPDKNVIMKYNILGNDEEIDSMQREINTKAGRLFDIVAQLFSNENLNTEYYKDDVQIGHTYFLVNSEEQLFLRFKYQILPILREYYKDGMFQFSEGDGYNDAFRRLLDYVSGVINLADSEGELKALFDSLIAEA